MADTTTYVCGDDARTGERGEKRLVRGERIALRLWEHEPSGEKAPEHANDYEYVAYVVSGAMRVTIDGNTVEVGPGDSYRVPEQTPYSFEILQPATVVEATSPPDA